jgi:hypothetical protein
VSLAEAAEARLLTCDEVRLELGQVAEGLARSSAPVRRHLKGCERCRVFKGELRRANRALAAVYPLGPLVIVKKFLAAKVGMGAGASTAGAGSGSGGAGFAGAAGAAASSAAGGAGAGASGLLSAGFGTVASKAVAGFAAAAIVTAGAVEAKHVTEQPQSAGRPAVAAVIAPPSHVAAAPALPALAAPPNIIAAIPQPHARPHPAKPTTDPAPVEAAAATAPATTTPVAPPPATTTTTAPTPAPTPTTHPTQPPDGTTQEDGSTVILDDDPSSGSTGSSDGSGSDGSGAGQSSPPGESPSAPPQPQSAPVVGEPDPGSRLSPGGSSH